MTYEEMHARLERIERLLKERADVFKYMSKEDHRALSVAVQIVGEVALKYKSFPVPRLQPRIPIEKELASEPADV